jgi:hypothetical protein
LRKPGDISEWLDAGSILFSLDEGGEKLWFLNKAANLVSEASDRPELPYSNG